MSNNNKQNLIISKKYFPLIFQQNILEFFGKNLKSDTETFLIKKLLKTETIKRQNLLKDKTI